jgi:hypothetical protein
MVPMKPNAVLLALISVVLVSTLPRQSHGQVLTNEALSSDRVAIYHQFLTSDPALASTGEASALNVSSVTESFRYKSFVDPDRSCLSLSYIFDLTTPRLHKLPAEAFSTDRIHLIDSYTPQPSHNASAHAPIFFHHASMEVPPSEAKSPDRPDTLITLSEIVFDDTHTHAAFRYTIASGPNSAKGATVLYELSNGSWKPSASPCSEWAR